MIFKPDSLALKIGRSLQTHPEQWKSDNYYLVNHVAGVSIWVANEVYGIEVNNHKPSLASRRHIRKAYKEWLSNRLEQPTTDKEATLQEQSK